MFQVIINGLRMNLVKGGKEFGAQVGEDRARHLFTDPQADHVDRVEQLVRQQLTLLRSAGKDDAGTRDQVENLN